MKKLFYSLVTAFLIFSFNSCSSDSEEMPGDTCDNLNVSYSQDILPIISGTCASSPSCHGSGSYQPNFLSYADVKSVADDGTLKQQVVDSRAMPQGSSLTQSQIDNFECWIADGAPDN